MYPKGKRDSEQSHLQIQTIGFLSHLYEKQIFGPFLILAPLSTLSNWVNEFERFCPTLKTVLYHGSKKERSEIRSRQLNRSESSFDDQPESLSLSAL